MGWGVGEPLRTCGLGGRGNQGRVWHRACLREVGMGGCLVGGWEACGRMEWRIPNGGGGVLKQRGTKSGRGMGELDTPTRGGGGCSHYDVGMEVRV